MQVLSGDRTEDDVREELILALSGDDEDYKKTPVNFESFAIYNSMISRKMPRDEDFGLFLEDNWDIKLF